MPVFNNSEFKKFMFKITKGKNQKLCSKLRVLSKNHDQQFIEVFTTSKVNYEQLEKIAKSKFSKQIKKLYVSIPVELDFLDDLCYLSTDKYFVNIESVKLRFSDPIVDDTEINPVKEIRIENDLSIHGLIIAKNDHIKKLKISANISGNFLQISNSKFNVNLETNFVNVYLSGIKFLNSGYFNKGYEENTDYTTVTMQDILFINSQAFPINFGFVQEVSIKNITVKQCNRGIFLDKTSAFQIQNVRVYKSGCGFILQRSQGTMRDIVVKECTNFGVLLHNSQIKYNGFMCINNGSDDIIFDDFDFGDEEDSTFIQEV